MGTVEGGPAQEAAVPVMDLNLLHSAVRDLNHSPVVGDLPIGGRLRFFFSNLQKLTQDSFILEVVQCLQIPFITSQVQTSLPVQATPGKCVILTDFKNATLR